MKETYRLEGIVLHLGEEREFPSGFAIRDIVVEIDGDSQYPQPVKFTAHRTKTGKWDKIAETDAATEGDKVRIDFELRGRKSGENYYTDLSVVKIGWIEQSPTGPGYDDPGELPSGSPGYSEASPVDLADEDIPF